MLKQKPVRLPACGIIQYSQLHERPERKNRDAPNGFGRKFGQKHFDTPALAGGMRPVGVAHGNVSATGHPLAFVGGKRPLDDEPNTKLHMGKQVPVSPSMEAHAPNGARVRDGFDVLRAAGDYHDNRKFGVNCGVLPTKNVGR
jgi:hypothetical protein